MSKLLAGGSPLLVSPMMAFLLGMNEAILVQQIHYYIEINQKAERNYHDGRYWTYNSYTEWRRTCFYFWSESTMIRTFKSLEKDGILLTGNYSQYPGDRRRWYSIDYDRLDMVLKRKWEEKHESLPEDVEFENEVVKLTTPSNQNDQINNIYYIYNNKTETSTKTSLNVLNGTSCDKHKDVRCGDKPFDPTILKRQVIGCCHSIGIMDDTEIDTLYKVIRYYYTKYRSTFMEEHPRLSAYAMKRVIDELRDKLTGYEPNELCELIDQHFNTVYGGMGTDYNICHFCSGEIMQNRSYETFGV